MVSNLGMHIMISLWLISWIWYTLVSHYYFFKSIINHISLRKVEKVQNMYTLGTNTYL